MATHAIKQQQQHHHQQQQQLGPPIVTTTTTGTTTALAQANNNNTTTTATQPAVQQEPVKPYKQRRPFETRRKEVENIRKKFPTKIPIIVERYQREVNLPMMDKTKFLVPQELTIMNFAIIIKSRLRVPTSRAFYFVINNQSMASTSKSVAEVYKEHKDADGFLYMTYASQEMFG